MPRVPIERFRQARERPRCGLGACVDAADLEQRGRPVVLKFLPPLHGEEELARFEDVARSLEPLRHASVVATLGHGLDGEVPFLALEPPEGRTVTELLVAHNDGARWPDLADVRAIVDGACAAAAVAHRMRVVAEAPVVHGLLSSHSVFAQRAGGDAWDVAVMDFALAALPGVAWRSAHDDLAGDPRPPEQLADPTAISCAGDVFALGVLAVTLLVPFAFPVKPKSWAHFVEKRWGDGRALLTAMRPDLPPALCDELMRALAPSPEDRHPDADRLRLALRRVAWDPVRELAPPQRPAEARAEEPLDPEASSPQMRLPSALVAEPEQAARFLRPAAPAHDVAPEVEPAETTAPADVAFAESTVPTASAVDALRAIRHAERATARREETVIAGTPRREETVVAGTPVRGATVVARPPAHEGTVVARVPRREDATTATALPDGDLFAEIPWRPAPAPSPTAARAVAVDDEDATLAEGSVPNDLADHTFSEAWDAEPSAPAGPVDKTRIGRMPARPPAATPPRPATLAPPSAPARPSTAPAFSAGLPLPPTLPSAALLAETTVELDAPPAWREPPPPPPPPPPPSRAPVVAAGVTAALLVLLALWWSLR
ncbi:MAG: hypothetical protein U0324_29490 [Polyangiales bacterium]